MGDRIEEAGLAASVGEREERADSPYAWYVLCVLICVYIFSSMDRTILSILAEDIKKSFVITDGQLGFLHGTAFSVFYALFGYPMGRLIDRWRRTKLLALAIAGWSSMTVLCGLSGSLVQMTVGRIGVGIGEAAASPAGFSLMSDWFTKRRRGLALGLFISGLSIGAGLALALGGAIVSRWEQTFPVDPPFGLHGWQVAFLTVGLPGLILSAIISVMREPPRGLSDGELHRGRETYIWSRFAGDVASVVPPLTVIQAARAGIGPLCVNLMTAAAVALAAFFAIQLSGDVMQWTILGVGYYAAFSSAQSMKHRDRATFALTWGTPAFLLAMAGFGLTSMTNIVIGFWAAPLALRSFDIDKSAVGLILGATTASCGVLGVIAGGRLADMAIRHSHSGRVWVGLASCLIPVPFVILMCTTRQPWVFFLCNVPVAFIGNAWLAAGAATIQELVLPRMRGTATTTYFLSSTMIGSGLGPYLVGKISSIVGSLAVGILCSLIAAPIAAVALYLCARRVEAAEKSKWDRARGWRHALEGSSASD